jgi:hypothetical protein
VNAIPTRTSDRRAKLTVPGRLPLLVTAGRPGLIGSLPTAYNPIVHPTDSRAQGDPDLICAHRVPLVIASVGTPDQILERVSDYGGVVLTDIARVRHAREAVASGVEGLILRCAGAGAIPSRASRRHRLKEIPRPGPSARTRPSRPGATSAAPGPASPALGASRPSSRSRMRIYE